MEKQFWEGFQKEAAISDKHIMLAGGLLGGAGMGILTNRLQHNMKGSLDSIGEEDLALLRRGLDRSTHRKLRSNLIAVKDRQIEDERWHTNISGAASGAVLGAFAAAKLRGYL